MITQRAELTCINLSFTTHLHLPLATNLSFIPHKAFILKQKVINVHVKIRGVMTLQQLWQEKQNQGQLLSAFEKSSSFTMTAKVTRAHAFLHRTGKTRMHMCEQTCVYPETHNTGVLCCTKAQTCITGSEKAISVSRRLYLCNGRYKMCKRHLHTAVA